jgi:hypothetical protein
MQHDLARAVNVTHQGIAEMHRITGTAMQSCRDVSGVLEKLAPLAPQMESVRASIAKAVGLVAPVADAINRIKDAVKPLGFILDKASDVMKILIEEPIAALIHALHFDRMIEEAADWLVSLVTGPVDFLKEIEALCPKAVINRALDSLTEEGISAISTSVTDASAALQAYVQGGAAAWRAQLGTLTRDLAGIGIDGSGTLTLGPWTAPAPRPVSLAVLPGETMGAPA